MEGKAPMSTEMEAQARAAAEARAGRIRSHLADAAAEYATALLEKDWRTLGFESVTAWSAEMLGDQQFTPEARQNIAIMLSDHGWTVRQIAPVTGASRSAIGRDLVSRSGTQQEDGQASSSPRQRAARQREARRSRKRAVARRDQRYGSAVPAPAMRPLTTEEQATVEDLVERASALPLPVLVKLVVRLMIDLEAACRANAGSPITTNRGRPGCPGAGSGSNPQGRGNGAPPGRQTQMAYTSAAT